MITDGEKCHYLAVKKLCALLRGVTSKHNGDLYCLNRFHSCSTKDKLKSIIMYVKIMIIFMQSLLGKMSTCNDNPEKPLTSKINKHAPSGYSLFPHCSFDLTKNRLIVIEVKTVSKGFVRI